MTVSLLPNAKQQFVDANGEPLAMGTVEFYIPGTETPKDTWSDANGSVLNTNPVNLDAAGEAIIYGNGQYRQIVKDSLGNTIWDQVTQDPASYAGTISPSDYLQASNNLNDLSDIPTAVLNLVSGLANKATPVIADEIMINDIAGVAGKSLTMDQIFQVISGLTADSSPDPTDDYVATYDNSSSAPRKVLLKKIGNTLLGTPTASTSGAAIDFTGFPAGVREISILFKGVSTNGSSNVIVQIGDSGGIETTGYTSAAALSDVFVITYTTGFGVDAVTGAAGHTRYGTVVIRLENSSAFTWVQDGNMWNSTHLAHFSGVKSLSAELTQLRITTVNGTDTFDAGEINVAYRF